MERISMILILTAVALGNIALARPQNENYPSEVPKETQRYQPPAAWKSVEIGDYYLRRKKYRGALGRYQEAVQTDPYYAPGYLGLGKVYDRLGLKQKALDAYRKYLDLLPSTKDAEEAKDVHRAIVRLERHLQTPKKRPATSTSRSPAPSPQ
jgi:tetratricopeptide (TPR) repeat protein